MRTRPLTLVAVTMLLVSLVPSVSGAVQNQPSGTDDPPYLDPDLPIHRRVDDLLARMTIEEKVGQMTQAERGAVTGDPTTDAIRSSVTRPPSRQRDGSWSTPENLFELGTGFGGVRGIDLGEVLGVRHHQPGS